MSASAENVTFKSLQLSPEVIQSLDALGYETPTPIQAETIPLVLAGRDVLGQAQTGTGKTAAFALPILSNIDVSRAEPQALVLAPTRELALQVAEAFQSYARHIKGFNVLPIYGGQGYDTQLRQLRRGVHVVVGTPGRVMDHIERGTLKLDSLKTLVLDEADEMLRMGFIDAVEWVLQHTPPTRQIALFSATMPKEIRRVAESHLKDPVIVKIASKTTTASTIRQRYWQISGGVSKLDALTRMLEVETFDAMLVFTRTKIATNELAEKLSARGYAAEALNGDIAQIQRERIVDRFKTGKLDIVVATDVAARGLDVERISHVVNYDIPYDTESYVHRIGRTGRAGRSGEAILFVASRERRMLAAIERATSQRIEPMNLPSSDDVNKFRVQRFGQRIVEALESTDLSFYENLLTDFQKENDAPPMKIAAALASLLQGDQPLLLEEDRHSNKGWQPDNTRDGRERGNRRSNEGRLHEMTRGHRAQSGPDTKAVPLREFPEIAMQRYRVDVGHAHGVKPGNIVGAIANEGDIDSRYIGHIEIFDDYTVIDLPDGMPKDLLNTLKKTRICGRPANLSPLGDEASAGEKAPAYKAERKPRGKADGDKRRPAGDKRKPAGDKRSSKKPSNDALRGKTLSRKPGGDKPFKKARKPKKAD